MTIDAGAVLALTGTGSYYGKTMSRGLDLAAKHIEAAGGPKINLIYFDHKSGDAAAGKAAITELGSKKVPAKFASYGDDLTVMLDGTALYQIFTLDGGGGTGVVAQGKPYFWGTRAITPNDPMPGLFQYTKQALPDAKTVGTIIWDLGEQNNNITQADVLKKIAAGGYTANGLYEYVPVGGQDFSQVLPKIKSNEPDILLTVLYGQDIGSFTNQAITAGLNATRFAFEFTPDGVNASKGTFDKDGYTFSYDYFDAGNPKSPLAKLFVQEFNNEYGENSRLLRRQLLREHVRAVGSHPPRPEGRRRHQQRRRPRQGAPVEPHCRKRLRRRRQDPRYLHPRSHDALGDEARDGCVRVQGWHGHAEGLLRHRRRRLRQGVRT